MGRPYRPPSESFCDYVFKFVCSAVEKDLEFYKPDKRTIKKKDPTTDEQKCGVKLLKCSSVIIDNECQYVVENSYNFNHDFDDCFSRKYEDDITFSPFTTEGIEISREDLITERNRESVSASFQNFVYKKLAERLDGEIKESTKKVREYRSNERPSNNSFLLFKSSSCVVVNIERPDVVIERKRKRWPTRPFYFENSCQVDRKTRILEAAVSPEWILNKTGTCGWRDSKRPKILCLKLKNTLSDGAIECVDDS